MSLTCQVLDPDGFVEEPFKPTRPLLNTLQYYAMHFAAANPSVHDPTVHWCAYPKPLGRGCWVIEVNITLI